MTASVIAAIHWQALRLRLKELPIFPRFEEGAARDSEARIPQQARMCPQQVSMTSPELFGGGRARARARARARSASRAITARALLIERAGVVHRDHERVCDSARRPLAAAPRRRSAAPGLDRDPRRRRPGRLVAGLLIAWREQARGVTAIAGIREANATLDDEHGIDPGAW